MRYPFELNIDDYCSAPFEYRCQVDQWLEGNGIIPQITKSVKVFSATFVEVMQYEVVDGELVLEKGWPRKVKLTRRQFKVTGDAFPQRTLYG